MAWRRRDHLASGDSAAQLMSYASYHVCLFALWPYTRTGSSLDVKDKEGHTPLHITVFNQHYNTVRALLEMGATVDPKTRSAPPPYIIATPPS